MPVSASARQCCRKGTSTESTIFVAVPVQEQGSRSNASFDKRFKNSVFLLACAKGSNGSLALAR